MGNTTSFKGDTKWFRERADNSVKCRCGHTITFPFDKKTLICSWCRHLVYRNERVEFEEKLKTEMKIQK